MNNKSKMLRILLLAGLLLSATALEAQVTERERPAEWARLVDGGRYMDRFEPMPEGTQGNATWGCADVRNRYTDNGIEFPDYSVWGGNILRGEDGLFHLFACGWPENSPKGHMFWFHSTTFHAVSDSPHGPFRRVGELGPGHNPEAFRLSDGRWVVYVIDSYYIADQPEGPWTQSQFIFDRRDRRIIEGLSNLTFTARQDGSRLMVCRGGGIWISRDGLSPYLQLSDARVYPDVEGRFEDPVVWRDSVQYHLIVNDWLGRIAWYLRSPDGLHWVTEPGEAYVPGISRHADGTVEQWFKYERAKVLQDEYGRVEQMNFAVIDTIKWEDLPNDTHSSKNICIPMNKGLLMNMQNRRLTSHTRTLRLLIRNEEGFDAYRDLDVATLRFGSYRLVNYGEGACARSIRRHPKGAIVKFRAKDTGIDAEEFAPKLIGHTQTGRMVYGYTRRPGYDYTPALLSARIPLVIQDSVQVVVENLGISASSKASVMVTADGVELGTATLSSLTPYNSTILSFPLSGPLPKVSRWEVTIDEKGKQHTNVFNQP